MITTPDPALIRDYGYLLDAWPTPGTPPAPQPAARSGHDLAHALTHPSKVLDETGWPGIGHVINESRTPYQ